MFGSLELEISLKIGHHVFIFPNSSFKRGDIVSEVSSSVSRIIQKCLERLPHMTPEELISYKIKAEVEDAEVYYRLYELSKETSWSEELPKIFYQLYQENLKHAEKLLEFYKRIFPGKELISVDLPSIKATLTEETLRYFLESDRLEHLIDILMKNEKLAKEICEYVSNTAENPEVRELAQWLAKREEERYDKLKIIKKLPTAKREVSNQ
ncbi:ferritin family protein [Thermococcus aggregans]|uniref:Ferritin family protein n=1 Tax=Thermococcus aggregans TaxID=110163 RepID=A0A9E7MXG9_THEAG|nr:ferritin family protein [Thermococcus aggregans]USS40594.1 ferritin family protein [Thermococcus aggregans]